MFAHGYGCDQHMWRSVAPAFERDFRTVTFDHVGSGCSDMSAYDPEAYSTLGRYARDVIDLARDLDMRDAIFVGHSVSAIIDALAIIEEPDLFSELVMAGPSPRYIDDTDYIGGFTAAQIAELLDFLSENPTAYPRTPRPGPRRWPPSSWAIPTGPSCI